MLETNISLQNRITTLLVIFSVALISFFTFIQINNQITNINRQNSYQLNLSSAIVRDNLQSIIAQSTPEEIPNRIQANFKELKISNLVNEAIFFDAQGKIIATTQDGLNDTNVTFKDLGAFEVLKNLPQDKWFTASVDNLKKKIYLYVSIKDLTNNEVKYAAKLSFPLADIQQALSQIYKPIIFTALIIILANIIFAYFLSMAIIGPIRMLNKITRIIAAGDLSVRTKITTNDELQELGTTFNFMTEELIKMKERAENANPLTKLPGNIVIHEQIDKAIASNHYFVVIYCDLDNFKAFNDKYGIANGDLAIKLTADIFKEAANLKGNSDDFIGHEGGDDFILLTTPQKAQSVADYITTEFDKRVRAFYSAEDLTAGHIIAHARDGSVKEFPIMTISLAGVSNEIRKISSYGEVTNIAAEVKKMAKAVSGSVFILDKRKS